MLAYARMKAMLEPQRADCAIEYTDGIEVDALLEEQLRQWYLSLLLHGAREHLAEVDVAVQSVLNSAVSPGGGSVVSLPQACLRALEIRMDGWLCAAPILPASALPHLVRRQRNPFLAATASTPVAVMSEDGRHIYAYPGGAAVLRLMGAVDEGVESYSFDESALASLEIKI